MKIGIVILNYNDSATTIALYDNIRYYSVIDEIVIVDNCSTDDSFQKIRNHVCSNCHLIRSGCNGGYAYGNNLGLRYLIDSCCCNYVIVANPDVFFSEDFIQTLVTCLENDEDLGAIAGQMHDTSNRPMRMRTKLPKFINVLFECFFIGRKLNNTILSYKGKASGQIYDYVEQMPGSLWICNSIAMRKIGYMDENTFLFYEEAILGRRFLKAGYKLALHKSASYIHKHSVSIKKNVQTIKGFHFNAQSRKYYERNYLRTNRMQHLIHDILSSYSLSELRLLLRVQSIVRKFIK